jgi:hypothetical protein
MSAPDSNCRYCTRTTDIVEIVEDLEVSILYITKDQAYRGRCILALKEHKTEFFQLDARDTEAFARDIARASKAIYEVFSPDKINYAAFGDTYPHTCHDSQSWRLWLVLCAIGAKYSCKIYKNLLCFYFFFEILPPIATLHRV